MTNSCCFSKMIQIGHHNMWRKMINLSSRRSARTRWFAKGFSGRSSIRLIPRSSCWRRVHSVRSGSALILLLLRRLRVLEVLGGPIVQINKLTQYFFNLNDFVLKLWFLAVHKQLNRWPCHSVSHLLILTLKSNLRDNRKTILEICGTLITILTVEKLNSWQ